MENRLVFTWGRFQPPTKGHQFIVDVVKKIASDQNSDFIIFSSATENKRNPIPPALKKRALIESFGTHIRIETKFIDVLNFINFKKYDGITMVVGGDRAIDFRRILDGFAKEFKIPSCVISIDRDPDSDDISGISGTRMKEIAKTGNMEQFFKWMPDNISKSTEDEILSILKMI